MATWPSSLPELLASGHSVQPMTNVLRTDMEAGAARQRQRSAARLDQVSVSWSMTDAQVATFRAWFADATTGIAGGAYWFDGLTGRYGMGGTEALSARFVTTPTIAFVTRDRWQVSGTLEVRGA